MTSRSQHGSLTQRAKDNLFSSRPSSIGGAGAAIIGTNYQPAPQYQPIHLHQHSSTSSAPFGTSSAYNSYANQASEYLSSSRSQGINSNLSQNNNNQTFSLASMSARPQNQSERPILASQEQLSSPLRSSSDPLQLEHIIGFLGLYSSLIVTIPNQQYVCAKGISNMVVLDNLLDPHQQQFLLGHDMPVTCLKGSSSGQYLVSGQEGTIHHKGFASPIFAWDISRASQGGDAIFGVFKGLTEGVSHCSLSPDDRFVIGCGQDCLLYVWDLLSGDMIYGQRVQQAISVLEWGEVKANGHEYSYEFFFTQGKVGNGNLYQGILTYESVRMQWNMSIKPFQYMLSSGINRSILCITLSKCNLYIYCGTSSGEVLIFRRDTLVFRLNLPLCSGGLKGIISLNNEEIICSGGDGSIIKLRGYDMKWERVEESKVDGTIESIVLLNNQTELSVATVTGNSYLVSVRNLNQIKLLTSSHTSSITCLSFPKYLSLNNNENIDQLNLFTTGSSNSEIRIWDLNNYSCISVIKNTKYGSVTSLCMIDSRTILSGWSNGTLLCSDIYGRGLWTIPSAHRDGILAIDFCDENLTLLNSPFGSRDNRSQSSLQYIATGGGEGTIRIWRPTTRELITEYIEHSRPVCSLKIDSFRSYYIHSVGKEGNIVTYDIKNNKKIALHSNSSNKSSLLHPQVSNSNTSSSLLNNLSQKLYENGEIITVDSKGKVFSWDIDYNEPVMSLQDPSSKDLICCDISPNLPGKNNSGFYLAYGGEDGIIRIIDLRTSKMISFRTNGSGSPIRSISYSVDGQQLVAVSDDSTISIWNLFLY